MTSFHFRPATLEDWPLVLSWLNEPHMQEFWDNSPEHREDILHFMKGEKQTYFAGTTKYWMGSQDRVPFAFILSDVISPEEEDIPALWRAHLSEKGTTVALDFGIGNPDYLGEGLAAPTLEAFVEFYKTQVDPRADTFLIDPAKNNPRALHVYEKAGFRRVGTYHPSEGAFEGETSYLCVKEYP